MTPMLRAVRVNVLMFEGVKSLAGDNRRRCLEFMDVEEEKKVGKECSGFKQNEPLMMSLLSGASCLKGLTQKRERPPRLVRKCGGRGSRFRARNDKSRRKEALNMLEDAGGVVLPRGEEGRRWTLSIWVFPTDSADQEDLQCLFTSMCE